MFKIIILYFLLLVGAVIWHEIGHLIALKKADKKDARLRFYKDYRGRWKLKAGIIRDYNGLTSKQFKDVYFYGLYFGLAVVLAGTIINKLLIGGIPLYIYGCRNDIKNLWRLF